MWRRGEDGWFRRTTVGTLFIKRRKTGMVLTKGKVVLASNPLVPRLMQTAEAMFPVASFELPPVAQEIAHA